LINAGVGKKPNLDEQQIADVSGILKYFLRELDEPLIAFDKYLHYIANNGGMSCQELQ
jgi:hypothetical protein